MDLKTEDGSEDTTSVASETTNDVTLDPGAKSKLGNKMNAMAKLEESRPAGRTTLKLPNDEADLEAHTVAPIETTEDVDALPSSSSTSSSKKSILTLFKNAVMIDFKINVYAIAFSVMTVPFLIALMSTLRRSQYVEQFSVADESEDFTGQNLSNSDLLIAILSANRLFWALWALVLRLTSSTSSSKRSTFKKFLPLIVEIGSVALCASFYEIRSSQLYTIITFAFSLYVHVILDILLTRSLSYFMDSLRQNAIVLPIVVTILVYLLPALMVLYAFSLEAFVKTPIVQFLTISVLYPGLMMAAKQLMLGKIGSSLLFNRITNTNEDFDLTEQHLNNYESTVRAIHGLWLPQVVGIYISLSYSLYLFLATLGFRIFTHSLGKYVIFRGETELIKTQCKNDGLFDFDDDAAVGVISPKMSRTRSELLLRQRNSGRMDKAEPTPNFKIPKTINVGADDFTLFKDENANVDFASMGFPITRRNEGVRSPEKNTPSPNTHNHKHAEITMHVSHSDTKEHVGNIRIQENQNFGNEVSKNKKSLLNASIQLRTNRAQSQGYEYNISNFKKEYEELQKCKQLFKKSKTGKADGWQAVGRQELGCQIWLKKAADEFKLVKCATVIDSCEPWEVLKFLRDHEPSKHPEYQKASQTELIEEVNSGNRVYRTTYGAVTPFSARDVVFRQRCFRLPDGSFVITMVSVDHPDGKASPNYVRMNLKLGGYTIEPNDHKVNVCIYQECDPKGSLPQSLAKLGSMKAAKRVIQVKSHFWYLSLWPDVRDRYTHEEDSCIQQTRDGIETFERSKKTKVLKELSWEEVKSKNVAAHAYYKKEVIESNTACQVLVNTTVRATSVEIASYLFYKMIDPSDQLVRRLNDHSFIWYKYYALGKLLHDRDSVYLSTRKQFEDGSFVVAFKSIKDDAVPVLEGALRSEGYGGYLVRPNKGMGKRSCQVTRFHFLDFQSSYRELMKRLLISESVRVVMDVRAEFSKRAEGKRIEEIRKARILESSVEWRDTRDKYQENEEKILKSGKMLFRQVVSEIDDLKDPAWLEITTRQKTEMWRKTVTTSNALSNIFYPSDTSDRWERRISIALVQGRGSIREDKKRKVMPTFSNHSSPETSINESSVKRSSSFVQRNSSRLSNAVNSATSSSASGLLKKRKWLYHGFSRTTIECDASLVMAWCCDDHFNKGVRTAYDRPNSHYVKLEEINDHNIIDYRQHNLEWPISARYVVMQHFREQDENGVYWIVSRCINYDKAELPPESSNCIEVEANSIVRITPKDEGKCELAYWAYSDPKGKIPNWVLKIKIPSIMSIVSMCKSQLDKNSLAAKRLTFSERMSKMRKRVAIKWNNEALVEKSCNALGALVAKFFVKLSYESLILGFCCFFLQESASDIITIIMCKRRLGIDMIKFQLTMTTAQGAFVSVLCLLSIAVSCIISFLFVQVFINPIPLPHNYFID
mmetsp:Transcript_17390/g.35915  ORF Transcript_17390/g.35915 Transcript_17390/m.35915 type:complete len:1447 (+) Transcript_17390:161-4501(+)